MNNIIDMHCDTIVELRRSGCELRKNDGHISLEKLQKGGCLAQCFAIFTITHSSRETLGPYDFFMRAYGDFIKGMEENKDIISQVRNYDEIMENRAKGKLSAILTAEDAAPIEDKIERVDELYEKGVRIISFTWNFENHMGYPNKPDKEAHMLPLKPFGIEALARMDELGITPDVSHLNEGGFWDVVKYSKRPFVATHSCCRALCDHPRNLTDEQLKALAQKGGMMGINFMSDFLKADSDNKTKIEYIIEHMLHVKKVAGIDTIGFGSDFDGIGSELEFGDYTGMPKIIDAMTKVFTDDEIDKICSGNALRIIKENWK